MKFTALLPVAFATSMLLAGCGDSDTTNLTDSSSDSNSFGGALTEQFGSVTARNLEPASNESVETAVIDGFNRFSLDVHRALAADAPGENTVVSGYSLATALAIAMSGTASDTRAALATLLHLDSIEAAELDPAINAVDLLIESRSNDDLTLRSANRLFVSEDLSLQPAFLNNVVGNYGAPVTSADFMNDGPAIVEAINAWVNQQTNGLIEKLVDEVNPDTIVNILNAILLDATWEDTFNDIGERNFTALSGNTVAWPYFGTQASVRTSITSEQTVIEIPYAGGDIVMLLVVPSDLTTFEQSLTTDTLRALEAGLEGGEAILSVPEWTTEVAIDAKSLLVPLGLPVDSLDFSIMLGADADRLAITDVRQKARIEVDKDGTRAAAATSVEVGVTSVPSEPTIITIDKPFWYAIRDRDTGVLLFSGRVADPSSS